MSKRKVIWCEITCGCCGALAAGSGYYSPNLIRRLKIQTKDWEEDDDFPLTYGGIVLYGDLAPKYEDATKMVKSLEYNNSFFVVVGTSFYTGISEQLMKLAKQRKANIVVVNDNATIRVPVICKNIKRILEENV